jgi:hypothetical protein
MSIAIIVPRITARLVYTLNWLFLEQLGVHYELLTEHPSDKEFQLTISYGNANSEFSIPDVGLLFESGLYIHKIELNEWNGLPIVFANNGYTIPFDVFSAIFYFLSRYEEYLPFTPDKHQRFPATESVLFKLNLLERPIVDEWVFCIGEILKHKGVKIQRDAYKFLPTYDIDIAWSYKNKGIKRTIGAYLKDATEINFSAIAERTSVLCGTKQDPYFSFEFTDKLHRELDLKPLYFVLAAKKNGTFDKHILPTQKNMKSLIKRISSQYPVGIHPSYETNSKPELFGEEKCILEKIINTEISISRQHYIKFSLPTTYRKLIEIGINKDYSMGYGTHLGFRAGTSKPFLWYDLAEEMQTGLQIIPFSFMDTTAHYELKLSVENAFERLELLQKRLQQIDGLLTTIFHNFSLGTDSEWQGWSRAYAKFCKQQ